MPVAPRSPHRDDRSTGAALVVTAGMAVLAFLLWKPGRGLPEDSSTLPWPLLAASAAIGFLLPCLYWTGYRAKGFIPPAISLFYGMGLAAGIMDAPPTWVLVLAVVALSVTLGSLFRSLIRPGWLNQTIQSSPRTAPRISQRDRLALVVYPTLFLILLIADPYLPPDTAFWVFAVMGGWLVAHAWYRLFRMTFELGVEPVLWLGYRVRAHGPGLRAIPRQGPLLIMANHACWWDPLFLAKVIHRPITPMMTSKFFDIWFLKPLMVYTFVVIRVPEGTVRRETPEIDQAIAALDAGECVVIFPEGYLRRKEDQSIRRFGRGVWEILRARPDTPVLACWIEGNWGSWTSFQGGPPLQNKRPDFRRSIDVALSEPIIPDPAWMENHLVARASFMQLVLLARQSLGLPELTNVPLPMREENEPQS